MEIKDEHKTLLFEMGFKEEDLKLFNGKDITYEYDEKKGVRLYDPNYQTSYPEYIDIDGWSSWSSEQIAFERNILPPAQAEARRRAEGSPKPGDEDLSDAFQKKFGKK
jgi:hypothetical protein